MGVSEEEKETSRETHKREERGQSKKASGAEIRGRP